MRRHDSFLLGSLALGVSLVATIPSYSQTFDIATLMSLNEEQSGQFGHSVSGAGDVNQDGFADVIVGAAKEGPGTSPAGAGRAYVFSGQDNSALFELKSPHEENQGEFGFSVSGAGDINQDGFADVIVGAWLEVAISDGRAYVFNGKDGSVLFELESDASPGSRGHFGRAVSDAGDVNDDGFPDVIVGAPSEDPFPSPTRCGRAYVFSGRNGSRLFELKSPNEEVDGRFGQTVSGAGDVNQDGSADVIVGAFFEDPGNSPQDAGRAYIFSGQDGSLLFELKSPNEEPFGWFSNVAGVGDVNQDGWADVMVGATGESPGASPEDAGRAYIFSGQDGRLLFELASPNEEAGGWFGFAVSGAGDVDRDGTADAIVGARNENPGASPQDAGRAYVFSGRDGRLLFQLASLNEESSGQFGTSVSAAGDVNQDGLVDLVVGAHFEDPGSSPDNAGRAYVFVSTGAPLEFRINSGGPNFTDTQGKLFVADRAYQQGGFGFVGGQARSFSNPVGGTDDDPLYQDLRLTREGTFLYRFDVSAGATYDVTLYLMAPAVGGAGNIVMDVRAEGSLVFDDLDVTAEAGGTYRALVKTFSVNVGDGRLDLGFRMVNKAAVVSAIAVVQQ